jgi:hypothetical protein
MKLIETDLRPSKQRAAAQVVTPPRPEHRRAYVSFMFTFSVLAATVTAVYTIFPKRDNELLTVALALHEGPGKLIHLGASYSELTSWGEAVIGVDPPFPQPSPDLEVVGVNLVTILNRPVAMVRYRIDHEEVSLFLLQAYVSPPRRFHRFRGDEFAILWRNGRYTLIAVGGANTVDHWQRAIGAP